MKVECPFCGEPVLDGERLAPVQNEKVHYECMVHNIFGGIEHHTAGPHAAGSCYEGSTLSYRESARQAVEWIKEHGYEGSPHED